MTCTPTTIEVDLAASGWFSFTCTLSTSMATSFAANVDWQATTSIMGETSNHFITFTSATGNTQTVTFSGNARETGNHQLLLSAREPGAAFPMDTVTVTVKATDSNAPVEILDETEGSVMSVLTENVVVQAAMAVMVLLVLMGALMIRGQAKSARENERRERRMTDFRESRGMKSLPRRDLIQQQPQAPRDRSSSVFDEFRKR